MSDTVFPIQSARQASWHGEYRSSQLTSDNMSPAPKYKVVAAGMIGQGSAAASNG